MGSRNFGLVLSWDTMLCRKADIREDALLVLEAFEVEMLESLATLL
jgi:hypothetical protein